MTLASNGLPIPFQFVNDRKNETTVGPQMRATSKNSGMPTISARTILSRRGQQAVAAPDPARNGSRPRSAGGAGGGGGDASVTRSATVATV